MEQSNNLSIGNASQSEQALNAESTSQRHLIIVANRLPLHLDDDESTIKLIQSTGGLATALGPLHKRKGCLWVGMSDIPASEKKSERAAAYNAKLEEAQCVPVYLTEKEQRGYYEKFSNSVIWPLFHDFPQNARFDAKAWQLYVQVNKKFCDAVLACSQPDDIIWVQDYQLMLLPKMLRDARPDALIGFFLHIPFPDYETFRMLPQRREVLEGLAGADLIGFHTYDYVRHFLSSYGRILGSDISLGTFFVDGRMVRTDTFPLGVDYEKFAQAGRSERVASIIESEENGLLAEEGMKNILSVGRLDYTKGVPELMNAYDVLLDRHPEWLGKIRLWLVCVPSRESVPSYAGLKRRVDELVGRINGKHALTNWVPVRYYYRSLDFDELCAMYLKADVMAVTPLRDGMNLVCKEYLATHDGGPGVLVLSEMAGAATELSEALLVNPFDCDSLADALEQALTMPEEEQLRRNRLMQRRLSRYTARKWAEEFMLALMRVHEDQTALDANRFTPALEQQMVKEYTAAHKRTILLDYDGTLVPFAANPSSTVPDEELLSLLHSLASDPANDVVILSGRDRMTLESWLSELNIDMVAEHGAWLWNHVNRTWNMLKPLDNAWMPRVRPVLEDFVDRTPGSMLEEKDYSLVWHYRACSTEIAERRLDEMRTTLVPLVSDMGLQLAYGNKIVEVKMANVDKGSAAYRWLSREDREFTLAIGDDFTDEDMFHVAPEGSWTVKVGTGPTLARCTIRDYRQTRRLLSLLKDASNS